MNALINQTKSAKILNGKIKNEIGKNAYLKSNIEPLRKKLVQPTIDAKSQIQNDQDEIDEISKLKMTI